MFDAADDKDELTGANVVDILSEVAELTIPEEDEPQPPDDFEDEEDDDQASDSSDESMAGDDLTSSSVEEASDIKQPEVS